MARCYFLCASRGSSLDQHSNNVSLFAPAAQYTRDLLTAIPHPDFGPERNGQGRVAVTQ